MGREREAASGAQHQAGPRDAAAVTDATAEFEEYTAPPRLDEHGRPIPKAKGLRAQGYDFPPKEGMPQPPLTKANLAKGIGVPEVARVAPAASPAKAWPLPPLPGMPTPAAPPPEPTVVVARPERAPPAHIPPAIKVTEDPLFEEYQRPGLKENPRTGKGLRHEGPPQPKAHEILSRIKEPEIEVATPKRFGVMPPREATPNPAAAVTPMRMRTEVRQDAKSDLQVARGADGKPETKEQKVAREAAARAAAHEAAVADQASLDAAADLAATSIGLTMSNPSRFGPPKTVVEHPEDEDIFAPHPEIKPAIHGEEPPFEELPSASVTPPPASDEPTALHVQQQREPAMDSPSLEAELAPLLEDAPASPSPSIQSAPMQRIPEVPRQPTAVVLSPAPASPVLAPSPSGPSVTYISPAPAATAPSAPTSMPPTSATPMTGLTGQSGQSGQPHTSGAPPTKAGGPAVRIAILQSDYHFDVTTRMAEAAKARAVALGATVTGHHHVPGVYDVPLAAKLILRRDDVDALVVVGAVVQGETGHDVIIARETARKLADLAFDVEKPVGLGITGPGMTEQQAQARINNGAHAVDSVVQQHRLLVGLRA